MYLLTCSDNILSCCLCDCSLNKKSEENAMIEANLNRKVEELRQRIQQLENKYVLTYVYTYVYSVVIIRVCTYVCV